jgi:uncharacterized membrane protein
MNFTNFFSVKNIVELLNPFYVNNYPFIMIVWNILLAMVPFGFFIIFSAYWKKTKFLKIGQKILASLIFLLWFIFLPNALYLITDIRHLINFCPVSSPLNVCVNGAWEIMFFFIYGAFGWAFFVIYLNQMRDLLAKIFSKTTSKIIILAAIPILSLGVLFGLTERYNSWDFFLYPLAIFQNLLRYMSSWQYFRNWLVFTAGYYILYFFGTVIFKTKLAKGGN